MQSNVIELDIPEIQYDKEQTETKGPGRPKVEIDQEQVVKLAKLVKFVNPPILISHTLYTRIVCTPNSASNLCNEFWLKLNAVRFVNRNILFGISSNLLYPQDIARNVFNL